MKFRAALAAAVLIGALGGCGESTVTAEPATGSFAHQPLWPFADATQAAGDHPAWHADPGATALAFTRDFLGFTEIDRVTSTNEQGREAWVGVGYPLPGGKASTAATIHLARLGDTTDAPWEVVGTRDDALTLESPPYGATVGPVIEAGGSITGVDESLHLQVRRLGQDQALGDTCCVPAGGERRPWSARVDLSDPPEPGVLTLVVWTGGHVAKVEAFAVTGLRVD